MPVHLPPDYLLSQVYGIYPIGRVLLTADLIAVTFGIP